MYRLKMATIKSSMYVFAETRMRNAHFILEDESAHSLDLYKILNLDFILKLSNIKLYEYW